MTEIVEKENVPVNVRHSQASTTKICIGCAMTAEDWLSLEKLGPEAIRQINAHGLLAFLGFIILDGELYHESDLIDNKMEET